MDISTFNILERVVVDKASDEGAQQGPRILVKKHSLIPSQFGPWFDGVGDQPGYAISRLMSSVEQRDWTTRFRLDPLANTVERPVIELHHGCYSDLARNSRSQIVFSFSAPVATSDGFLFYGTADRGFLWAHGFLCRFQGSFDTPTTMDYLNVWQS
jgi:hypothetical protein